jgi:hypothetical protein
MISVRVQLETDAAFLSDGMAGVRSADVAPAGGSFWLRRAIGLARRQKVGAEGSNYPRPAPVGLCGDALRVLGCNLAGMTMPSVSVALCMD